MWEIGHGQKTTLSAQNGQYSLSLSLQGFIIVCFVAFSLLASVSETDALVPLLLCYSSFRHTEMLLTACSALWEKLAPMLPLSVTSETTIRRAPSRKARNKAARLVRPIKEKSIVPGAPTLLEPTPHLCALRSSHAPHAPAEQTHIEGLLCHLGRGFSNGK